MMEKQDSSRMGDEPTVAEIQFQDDFEIIKMEMDEMDACPKCTETVACQYHKDNAMNQEVSA